MSSYSIFDHQMMARALELAKRGIYTTAPNPNVGCVIVQNGEIVGEGFHHKAGEPHAEVHAMRMAGSRTQGATAYVTLEPCSHYGRTPPCAEGLINAKVAKVVCAMEDPNPKVAGRGIKMLQQAGIEVEVGLLREEALALNPGFIKRMKTGMPFVQLKMAASLDGQTALNNGQSQWITSPQARKDVQGFRAKAGAILSTSKTVVDDNATLNVRHSELPSQIKAVMSDEEVRQPTRVILDRTGQLDDSLKLWQAPGQILTVSHTDASHKQNAVATEVSVPLNTLGQLDLKETLSTLSKQHDINHIWVEAGATLARSLIEQQLVDEIVLYLAPKLMGSDGRGLFGALGLENMSDVLELDITDLRQVGSDIRVVACLKQKED
ncbi:bifunctional diaminohydroxyphosphoribosylaminopyrimidine deaminase/5-amino-6-(5-phosphoribosylamino)uracil reductase RibD [Vibrio paucivorans]|uniref:Riboflavin biosynthesis protein RibD n=1 Tax=Vibrio paucivorans TaxID=2829489 RepID=A0A9X3HPT7_9VIBR|nr:bifunctional diaminohydroxyphosphoribosylaminopyrimidine deaminase/5-amino-6-(5-phosphoribosylamino)uracil reductase RibD [Vibrio paucivorans]MCW8332861.1 bifunctional diaminohydroxyphosphoribosylaminopyrimidine deaminase/5-amino-6-(5-phosphoribosylamino)uracil reductase RibD [Vibrio paucivorans]